LFANIASLHQALLEKEPRDFVSHYIFQPIPYVFRDDLSVWISWKTTLARLLEVDAQDIVLTGSEAIGYSLNPYKNYKLFDETSDIDCGVISQYHFYLEWPYLRQLRPSWLSLPGASKRAIQIHQKNYMFYGTIATDVILSLLPFGIIWQNALNEMGRIKPTLGREVRLRIYKDYDALRHYQARNIESLRNDLGDKLTTADDIVTEE
jgi:hypothetical protein